MAALVPPSKKKIAAKTASASKNKLARKVAPIGGMHAPDPNLADAHQVSVDSLARYESL
jgi:hypothetical protein